MDRVGSDARGIVMRIGKHGQVTIPKALRDRLGLTPGVEVEFTATGEGLLVRKRAAVMHPVDRVAGILDGVFDEDVDAYIEAVRGR